ncbi:hypothetical protein AB0M44_44050, partial [Streptosporangium subroseum]|uniref:hypothetical protein n=1 Tax=Streptosporangium subroseum TaxID=106412 RepID=UPI00342901F5
AARTDTSFDDVLRLLSGITMIHFAEPGQLERVVGMALDGLRYQPASIDQESRAVASVASVPSVVSR